MNPLFSQIIGSSNIFIMMHSFRKRQSWKQVRKWRGESLLLGKVHFSNYWMEGGKASDLQVYLKLESTSLTYFNKRKHLESYEKRFSLYRKSWFRSRDIQMFKCLYFPLPPLFFFLCRLLLNLQDKLIKDKS